MASTVFFLFHAHEAASCMYIRPVRWSSGVGWRRAGRQLPSNLWPPDLLPLDITPKLERRRRTRTVEFKQPVSRRSHGILPQEWTTTPFPPPRRATPTFVSSRYAAPAWSFVSRGANMADSRCRSARAMSRWRRKSRRSSASWKPAG